MPGTSLNFDTRQLYPILNVMQALESFNADTQPLMLAIAHDGLQQTLRRFEMQVDPTGKPWVPSKAALKERRKTLIKTGHFMLNTFSAEATADQAVWGTNAVQGRIFQLGGQINMPAREGTLHLRTRADGSLMRQSEVDRMGPFTPGQMSRLGNLSVFAKPNAKGAVARDFKGSAFTINVIARPFLGVNAADEASFINLASDRYAKFFAAHKPGGAS